AIASTLIGLLLAATQRIRLAAQQASCQNNIRQIILAVHNYADTNNASLPTVTGSYPRTADMHQSLFIRLLPYVEKEDLFRAYESTKFTVRESVLSALKVYSCPGDPTLGGSLTSLPPYCSYAANAYAFSDNPSLKDSFADGT